MNTDRLDALLTDGDAFDTETHRIQDGLAAPPLVCGSAAGMELDGNPHGVLLSADEARQMFRRLLRTGRTIIGANLPYDLIVMAHDAATRGEDLLPEIFQMLAEGRAYDIQTAEALNAIADGMLGKDPRTGAPLVNPETGKRGRYSLSIVTEIVLGREGAKANDRFRLSYALLENTPIEHWPPDAAAYPVDDAVNTLEVGIAQVGLIPRPTDHDWRVAPGDWLVCAHCGCASDPRNFGTLPPCKPRARRHRNLHNLSEQVFKSFCLALGGAWGLRTDPVATEALIAAAQEGRDAAIKEFAAEGFLREDGSEDSAKVKAAVARAYGCTGTCTTCGGTGKIYNKFSKRDPSKPVGKPIQCKACSATGLDLSTAPVPMSDPSPTFPGGQVQTGRDILIESGDERLMEYAATQEDDKIVDSYGPWLRGGYHAPLILKPNNPLETGRVSYDGLVQTLPRAISARLAAKLKARGAFVIGVRDCIVPRGPQYETVEVPDDYNLQPGEEWCE